VSTADTMKLRVVNFVIVSARTACRWDRCHHRWEALPWEWRPHNP
jgi:hypothetical protein